MANSREAVDGCTCADFIEVEISEVNGKTILFINEDRVPPVCNGDVANGGSVYDGRLDGDLHLIAASKPYR